MLALRGVSRRFGGLRVIEELDLTVAPGEILGVLGPNGARKSTLFNLVAGVLPPNEGRISFMRGFGADGASGALWPGMGIMSASAGALAPSAASAVPACAASAAFASCSVNTLSRASAGGQPPRRRW